MNDIIEEVREAKRLVNARFDNDIHKYCIDVRRRQEELKKQGVNSYGSIAKRNKILTIEKMKTIEILYTYKLYSTLSLLL